MGKMAEDRVLLADDHPLIREALQMAIRLHHPSVVIDAADSIDAAEALVRKHKHYRFMLLDYRMPDSDGFSGFFRMQTILGNTPIALISAFGNDRLIAAARAVGAAGFLSKTQPLDEMIRSLDNLLEGRTIFPAEGKTDEGLGDLQDRIKSLSGAQMRVIAALARGSLNKQIAADLEVSEATVKAHLTAIFRKLKVNNRLQAMLLVRPLFSPESP